MAKIRKTALEIKQNALMKKHFKKIKPKNKPKKKSKPKTGLNADYLRGESYAVFLNSDYWKTVRVMVLKRDNRKCVICGATKLLQVHHDTYKNHFKEHLNLGDLMTLCKSCHTEHHHAQL